MANKRLEERHTISNTNRKYIKMAMKISEGYIPVERIDFSQHGFKIMAPIKSDVGTTVACKLSIPDSISHEVFIKMKIHHHCEKAGSHIMGGEIVEVEDPLWFDIYQNVRDFLIEREGEVY